MFFGPGEFWNSRQAVNKALRRLHKLGIAEPVGEVSFKGEGGHCIAWAAKGVRVKRNQLKHDCIVSMVRRALGYRSLRAPETDPARQPDLTLYDEHDAAVDWEIDTGSITYRELREARYAKFVGTDRPVVWVSCGLWNTTDSTRLEGMRVRAVEIADDAWFMTLGDLLRDRRDAKLWNYHGEETTVSDLFQDQASAEPEAV